jgi:hypothetical protein
MGSRKPVPKKGLLPKLKSFLDGLGDRYHRALMVIDEALASDNLKDKIWAVDLILKRSPTPEVETQPKSPKKGKPLSKEELAQLSDVELLQRMRSYLKDWEP